jgi:Dyp-type peroxidase family
MTLDLADIQGNVLTAYGKLGFPKGRVLLFHVASSDAGRAFVERLRPLVTTALRWPSSKSIATGELVVARPAATLNLAFTFQGLLALGVPVRTLRGLPDEFIDGMAARARMLGDDVTIPGAQPWDAVWKPETAAGAVHILALLNAQADAAGRPAPALETLSSTVQAAAAACGVTLLRGHGPLGAQAQELSAIFEDDGAGGVRPTPREHFGFIDAISDPVFHGQLPDHAARERAPGGGKIDRAGRWTPLATGEFLLGYADEAEEIAGAAMPLSFSRNGTFFAYRKLHQNVEAFSNWLDAAAPRFAAAIGLASPSEGRPLLMAKVAGRWPDGIPIESAPTIEAWRAMGGGQASPARLRTLNAFTYGDDADGARCPLGSHVRRMNPRDALDPLGPAKPGGPAGSQLNNRRRILRRGLPYGEAGAADGEHGIVFMAVCASLFRQFEFVQQQWLNYGLDFNAGNDTCPLVGNHPQASKFVIPAGKHGGPFILGDLPQFVETRGGEYFFTPSLTALRMIGRGLVDPT